MAMTKAEKAILEEALRQAAFRRTAPVERDLPPPEHTSKPYSQGWDFNAHSMSVFQEWSGAVSHGTGLAPKPGEKYRSASQGSRRLFSTAERAYAAMRWAIEEEAATKLRAIDKSLELLRIKEAP